MRSCVSPRAVSISTGVRECCADAAQDLEAVRVRHHHVQHDQRVIFGEGPFDAGRAVGGPADGETFARQKARDELAQLGIVIDHQHAFHGKTGRLYSKTRACQRRRQDLSRA